MERIKYWGTGTAAGTKAHTSIVYKPTIVTWFNPIASKMNEKDVALVAVVIVTKFAFS